MKDFVVQGSIVSAGAGLGALAAWIFGGVAWIGALIGGVVFMSIIIGFYIAVYAFIMMVKELFGG